MANVLYGMIKWKGRKGAEDDEPNVHCKCRLHVKRWLEQDLGNHEK